MKRRLFVFCLISMTFLTEDSLGIDHDVAFDLNSMRIEHTLDVYKITAGVEFVTASNVKMALASGHLVSAKYVGKDRAKALEILRRAILLNTGIVLTHLDDKRVSVTYNDLLKTAKDKIME